MGKHIDHLIEIIETLRGPDGCPWDREQDHKSILFCFLEEVYEFFQTVEDNDPISMKEELGDVLLQIALHAQMEKETGQFDLEDVAKTLCEKLIRRHPHVFGSEKCDSSKEVLANWEEIKQKEKGSNKRKYFIDDIPGTLPSLFRAEKIQRRVARVGFDWNDVKPALDKVEEEFLEFRQALEENNADHASEELGDILFALVNVARHKNICAEDALRQSVNKFSRRFRYIEDSLKKSNKSLKETSLEELDAIWEESKKNIG